jgi:hypothetical protein
MMPVSKLSSLCLKKLEQLHVRALSNNYHNFLQLFPPGLRLEISDHMEKV